MSIRIVSGGDDGKAVIWDWRSGERLALLDGHTLPITTLLFFALPAPALGSVPLALLYSTLLCLLSLLLLLLSSLSSL
jgi:WD40 repeat protein